MFACKILISTKYFPLYNTYNVYCFFYNLLTIFYLNGHIINFKSPLNLNIYIKIPLLS